MLERKFFKKFMEKTCKVLRIVLSCVSFALIVMFFLGLFALPLFRGANIYDMISTLIDQIKAGSGAEIPVSEMISALLAPIVLISMSVVFGIIGIVKSIRLLIHSIKALSSEEAEAPVKSLMSFGILMLVFVACLQAVNGLYEMGAGSYMFLIAGLLAVCGVGVYRFFENSKSPLLNKILGLGMATAGVVGILFMVRGLVATADVRDGAIGILMNGIQGLIGGHSGVAALIFSMFGAVILFVGLGFACKVVAFGVKLEAGKEEEYDKGSILKSALWFGFLLVGFLLVVIPYSASFDYSVSASGIVALVFASLALACAIVSKVLGPKEAK